MKYSVEFCNKLVSFSQPVFPKLDKRVNIILKREEHVFYFGGVRTINIKGIVETLSHEDTLNVKELVLILFGEEKSETVYQSIKDTAN